MSLQITLADGAVRNYDEVKTPLEIAADISKKLAKRAVIAKVDGRLTELTVPLEGEHCLEILTFDDEEGKNTFRHSSSHIMAQAVKRLFPEAKLGIGPAIRDGFYYDFDCEHTFTEEDFAAIEKEMAAIVKEDYAYHRSEMPRAEASAFFAGRGETYKVELINDLPADAVISLYDNGDFTDLCAGPHLPSTGKVKAFKLMSLAGAYWRGSEKNKMLQRIYATSFAEQKDLDEYLFRLEEAKKRDHRKLGAELGLFMMADEGPGFPFFLPKGMDLRNELESFWRQEHKKAGYLEIKTPMILNQQLWLRSGHWDHYKENMYMTEIDGEPFAVKPMNCPGGMIVYKSQPHSYRELPLRVGEMGLVHRHELSGALHGLMRVRCFTQDDAHIFMMPEQIKDEIIGVIRLIDKFYSLFGFKYHVELSTKPEKAMGDDAIWDVATNALREAMNDIDMPFVVNEGDGAFYGPKLDFHLEDSLGRTWQCGTIQLDFQMPEKFELTYIGADNQPHRPVMIHRVIFGSIERFIGILTEHFAGAFPLWLAPVQVKVLTITDRQDAYAKAVFAKLQEAGLRAELDLRNEKIGFKIRAAQEERVPYMLILGDKEQESAQVAVRARGKGDLGAKPLDDLIRQLLEEIKSKI
ncbi:MAG: threonine--tRNA ligase [Clostridia bacterium]|nr:threonine--tRNA ligase [Clostridia bacterium]